MEPLLLLGSVGNTQIFTKFPDGSIGNVIRFDEFDNMYITDYVGHNILYIPAGNTVADVYLHSSFFNQPNDLAIMSNGILLVSDPNWSKNNGKL